MQPLLVVKFMSKQVLYDFRDEFSIPQALGKVNGTRCSHRGTRTVVDTDNKLTISSGKLNMAPHSTPAWGDPRFHIDEAIIRAAGVLLKFQLNITDVTQQMWGGVSDAKGIASDNGFTIATDLLTLRDSGSALSAVFVPLDGTDYEFVIALKSAGMACFIKTGGVWKFLGNWGTDNTATNYAGITNRSATLTSDYLRLPSERWLPVPLCSDGMSSAGTTDGLGHLETSGLGSGGSGLSYTDDGTWSVAAGKAVNTPTEGGELWDADAAVFTSGTYSWVAYGTNTIANVANELVITYVDNSNGAYVLLRNSADLSSDLTVGQWYICQFDAKEAGGDCVLNIYDGVGTIISNTLTTSMITYNNIFKARSSTACNLVTASIGAGETVTLDNLSLKPLTLSSLFSSLSLSTQDVVASADLTVVAGTQAGMVICLDSAASPANFLLSYHNGVNAILEKCVAGTYTTLISAAATYAANAAIVVHKDGTKVRLFYNNALIGTEQTVSDAGIINNKLHGKFSTYNGNTIDNLHIEARGNQGQYALIDRW